MKMDQCTVIFGAKSNSPGLRTEIKPDGSMEESQFSRGKKHGSFIFSDASGKNVLTTADGVLTEQNFDNGEPIGWCCLFF